jgi:phenylalanine-4-hydroxylase
MGIDGNDALTFIKTTGPSAIAIANKQLEGHGKFYHKDGFSSPVGRLKNQTTALEDLSLEQLKELGIATGKRADLTFESGIHVTGLAKKILQHENKTILISFEDCTVKESNGNVLFQPEWGMYDMAVGESIVSVFNGAADKDAYEEITHISDKQTHKVVYDEKTQQLHAIYRAVREIRENGTNQEQLPILFGRLKSEYRHDWLSAMEVLEILYHKQLYPELEKEVRNYLELKSANEADHTKLINDGLHVIENPVTQLINNED